MKGSEGINDYEYLTFPKRCISYRWYHPMFVAILTFVIYDILSGALSIGISFFSGNGISMYHDTAGYYDAINSFDVTILILKLGRPAMLLPALYISTRLINDRPFSSYSSSRGGWDMRYFLKCFAAAITLFGVVFLVNYIAAGGKSDPCIKAPAVIVILILTPLQCIAEEYLYRGFMAQSIASWTDIPLAGIIVSSVVFALMHPYNIVGVINILFNGLVLAWLVHRTGGLEAASAVHIMNNLCALLLSGMGITQLSDEVNILQCAAGVSTYLIYAVIVVSRTEISDRRWMKRK